MPYAPLLLKSRPTANANHAQAIPPELQQSRRPKGAAIITDVDDGTGPIEDLPEPSKEGALDVARDEQGKPLADGTDPKAEEAPFSRTGWAPRLGWPIDDATEQESLLDHATWVEGQLPDTLYGGMSQFNYMRIQTTNKGRLVPQHGRHHFCLYLLLACSCLWRRPWLDHHHYGLLLDLLPNVPATSAT